MKDRLQLFTVLALSALLAASLLLNCRQHRDLKQRPVRQVVTTVTVREHTDTAPQPRSEVRIRVVHVPLKPAACGDTLLGDTLAVDSGRVEIPITQQVYEDSLYTAYVSGYRPSLDSIRVRERIVTTTVTERLPPPRRSRWSLGLTGGYGLGLQSRRVEPFVGVGVTYRLWPP